MKLKKYFYVYFISIFKKLFSVIASLGILNLTSNLYRLVFLQDDGVVLLSVVIRKNEFLKKKI